MVVLHVFTNKEDYEFSTNFKIMDEAKAFQDGLTSGASLFAGSVTVGYVVDGKLEDDDGQAIDPGAKALEKILKKDAELSNK